MTIGAALALIVVGAILRFAITTSINGIAIPTIGVILMIVGVIGVVQWLIFWAPLARRRRVVYREAVPPEEVPPVRRRRMVYQEDVPAEEVPPPARRYPADTRYDDEYPP